VKFSKLMCLGFIFLGGITLLPDESKIETYHVSYIGYEHENVGVSFPVIGYRYQYGSYILDLNGGYKYIKTLASPFHFGKIGINGYKSFISTIEGQIYAGVGIDCIGIQTKVPSKRKERSYGFHPSVSIGHEVYIGEDKKLFTEIVYKPYEVGKNKNTFIHSASSRIGIGF